MGLNYTGLITSAEARLARSKEIAAAFSQDREAHTLLMEGVFALEDFVFLLHEMRTGAALDLKEKPGRSWALMSRPTGA